MTEPSAEWRQFIEYLCARGVPPEVTALVAWTFQVTGSSGLPIRPLAPSEAFAVVSSVTGVNEAALKAAILARDTRPGRSEAEYLSEARDLLLAMPGVAAVQDPRELPTQRYLESVFKPDPLPPLVARPSLARLRWSDDDLAAFPFLRATQTRWQSFIRDHVPDDGQVYRALLAELFPRHRASAHLGVEFETPPGSEYVRCVGTAIRSGAEFGRRIGPFLLYLWNSRNDSAADPGEALFNFIVTGDPGRGIG